VQLSEQALDPRLFSSPEGRDSFLQAHGTVSQFLDENVDARDELPAYLCLLGKATKDPKTWRAVKDDPVALLIRDDLKDPDLRDFYVEQRDWLAEVVVQLAPIATSSSVMGLTISLPFCTPTTRARFWPLLLQ
jgi:hypothetical protein